MGLVRSILLAGGGGPGGAFHYLWDGRVIFPRSRATDRGSYTKDGLKSSFQQKRNRLETKDGLKSSFEQKRNCLETKDGLKSSFEKIGTVWKEQFKSCVKVLQRSGAIAYDL